MSPKPSQKKRDVPSSKAKWETLQILPNLPCFVKPSLRIEILRIGEVFGIPSDRPNVADDGGAFRDTIVLLRVTGET